ncbi:hypothetical protein LEMLEM_LOCUS6896 [Lemmus lemmus]
MNYDAQADGMKNRLQEQALLNRVNSANRGVGRNWVPRTQPEAAGS